MEKETKKTKKVEVKKEKSTKILGSRITEKAARASEKNMYTFNVASSANKTEIKKEIEKLYKVKPVSVNITIIADKMKSRRGKLSVKRGGKKAVVHLKKGDKIILA